MTSNNPKISLIVPAYNEAESLPLLYQEIREVMGRISDLYEIIIVNDGSTDNTGKVIEDLHAKDPEHVIGIHFYANYGKTIALNAGFKIAQGDIVFTLDADLQDDPQEINKFIEKINAGYDLVSGWKKNRQDSFLKNKSSKLFNFVTRKISGVELHDFNCGFKAYRKEYVKKLNIYGELHRYIPVILKTYGCKMTEVIVNHRKRQFGYTKFGMDRFIKGFLDLFTVIFITRYNAQPLHLFGVFGLFFFLLGSIFGVYLLYIRITTGHLLTHEPLLIFSVMLVILGIQTIFTGLISEQIVNTTNKNNQNNPIRKITRKLNNE